MNNFVGMDPAEVRQIGRQLDIQSKRLSDVTHAVDVLVRRAMADWAGSGAHHFSQQWTAQLRPQLFAAQNSMHSLSVVAIGNANEQEGVSRGGQGAARPPGGAAAFGGPNGDVENARDLINFITGLGLPYDILKKTFGEHFLPRLADGTWRSAKDLHGWDLVKALHDKDNYITEGAWKKFEGASKALGILGIGMSAFEAYDGFQSNDSGKITTGSIGVVAGAAGLVFGGPLTLTAGATLFVGQTFLPVNNDEYSGSFDKAMYDHFGAAYDPENPTREQSDWAMKRYEGVGGFVNSLHDGISYKVDKLAKGAGELWNGMTSWMH